MSMLRHYIQLLISEIELRLFQIDDALKKESITDGRRLILHGCRHFFHGFHPK